MAAGDYLTTMRAHVFNLLTGNIEIAPDGQIEALRQYIEHRAREHSAEDAAAK